MTIIKFIFAAPILGALLAAQTKPATAPAISEGFRSAAENVMDCLDAANTVAHATDTVFYAQSTPCRPMLRRLERVANSEKERSVAHAIHEYQTQLHICHLTQGICVDINQARENVIKEGALRVPDAAAK
jgi:hypothetical protein